MLYPELYLSGQVPLLSEDPRVGLSVGRALVECDPVGHTGCPLPPSVTGNQHRALSSWAS